MKQHQPLVMVVEDEPDIRRMLHDQLTLNGYKVLLGEIGTMSLLDKDYWTWVDIAVVDAMMPHVSGKQVLTFLASNLPKIRRVLCTASLPFVQEWGHLADAVVVKPYSLSELLRAVKGPEN